MTIDTTDMKERKKMLLRKCPIVKFFSKSSDPEMIKKDPLGT